MSRYLFPKRFSRLACYLPSYSEGIGRYQIISWAAQTGNAGFHHSGYYILDTVTGEVVDQKLEMHGPEE